VDTIVKYRQFFIMIILWLLTSIVAGPVNIGLITLSVLILKLRNRYTELLVGFLFVCTMSDNRLKVFSSFESAKYVYIVLLTLFLLFDSKKFRPLSRFFLAFLPFIIVACYCIIHTPSANFIQCVLKTLSYFFLLLTIPNYVNKSYRDNGYDFIRLLIYSALFLLSLGLLLRFFIPSAVSFEERYRGLLGNPNGMGLYCLVIFVLTGLLNKSLPDLFHRQEKIILYLLLIVSVFLCGSRNSIVAILIFIAFSYLTRISPVLSFVILLFILTGYEYIDINIVTIVKSLGIERYFRIDTLSDAAGRYVAWGFAWKNISKNIFYGHGIDYTDYLFILNQDMLNTLGHQGNAHNSYLTFWLDTGIVGLLLYLWAFIGKFIKAARKNKLIIAALYAILFSVIFESYLTASLTPNTIIIFVLLSVFTSDEILPIKTEAIIPLH